MLGGRVAREFAQQLHVQPVPFELPGYRSLLCWDRRSDADSATQWLKEQIAAMSAALSSASYGT